MEQHLQAKRDDAHLLHTSLLKVMGRLGCPPSSLSTRDGGKAAAGGGGGAAAAGGVLSRGQRLMSVMKRLDGLVQEGDRSEEDAQAVGVVSGMAVSKGGCTLTFDF